MKKLALLVVAGCLNICLAGGGSKSPKPLFVLGGDEVAIPASLEKTNSLPQFTTTTLSTIKPTAQRRSVTHRQKIVFTAGMLLTMTASGVYYWTLYNQGNALSNKLNLP